MQPGYWSNTTGNGYPTTNPIWNEDRTGPKA